MKYNTQNGQLTPTEAVLIQDELANSLYWRGEAMATYYGDVIDALIAKLPKDKKNDILKEIDDDTKHKKDVMFKYSDKVSSIIAKLIEQNGIE